jgi:hypothetical protein
LKLKPDRSRNFHPASELRIIGFNGCTLGLAGSTLRKTKICTKEQGSGKK